ncbi:unnamed protein product [Bursaphelenchus xylophilus]|uniref:(pine wood nematode) hypothetical protein n=1 Tax=Bursaphelenchus xylophilus TaxID=6326 RepID=A0A1I7S206_BURXY|nr:unnamed protein product [Bursaphelenchus xylophilus]CAG9090236.1 unnamed protein product [Bursaphelenchus xylophilus]
MSQGPSSDLDSQGASSMRFLFGGSAEALKAAELAALKAQTQADEEDVQSSENRQQTERDDTNHGNGDGLSTVYEESAETPVEIAESQSNGNGTTQEVPEEKIEEQPQEVPEVVEDNVENFLEEKEETQQAPEEPMEVGEEEESAETAEPEVEEPVEEVQQQEDGEDKIDEVEELQEDEEVDEQVPEEPVIVEEPGEEPKAQSEEPREQEEQQNEEDKTSKTAVENSQGPELLSVWAQKPESEQIESPETVIEPAEVGEKDKDPAEEAKTVEDEEISQPEEPEEAAAAKTPRSTRRGRKSEADKAQETPKPAPRSSRRNKQTEIEESVEEKEEEKPEEPPAKTPRRGRRSVPEATEKPVEQPKSAPRGRRGRRSEPEKVEEEEEKVEVETEEKEKKPEEVDEVVEEVEEKPKTSGRTPRSAKKADKTPASTAKPKKTRLSQADKLKEDLKESGITIDEDTPAGGRRSSRRKPAEEPKAAETPKPPKNTPKSRKTPSKKDTPKEKEEEKDEEMEVDEEEKEEAEEEPKPTPRRGRKAAEKSEVTPKKPARGRKPATEPRKPAKKATNLNKTADPDDPFNFDSQGNNHPQPLFSVTKAGFSNIKFTLSPRNKKPAEARYANTEKAVAERLQSQPEDPEEPEQCQLSITELSTSTPSGKAALKSVTPRSAQKTPKARTPAEPKSAQRAPKEKKETPKAVEKRAEPEITAPVVPKEDQKDIDFAHEPFPTGMRVFALWGRELYPAIVVDRDGLGRYKVFFVEDNLHRDIPPTGIVPLAWLKEGTSLTITNDDELQVDVQVTNVPATDNVEEWVNAIFEVKDEEGNYKTLPWSKLYLTLQQQKTIGVPKNKSVVVGEDNVVPRSRRSHAAVPTTPQEPKKTPGRKRKADQEETTETPTEPKAKRGRKPKTPLAENTQEEVELSTEELFKGRYYLLTSSARRANITEFNKREFKAMIEARGGHVAEEISELPEDAEAYLVADTFYRTHKYLFALAADIPCVHFSWVQQCVDQNKILPYQNFLLPAGISALDDEQYPCKPLKGRLLKGKRMLVYSSQPAAENAVQFTDIWRPLLNTLGATVLKSPDSKHEETKQFIIDNDFDYMLTDRSCTPELVQAVEAKGKKVVSSNLVIHGIVTGDWVDVSAHPSFSPSA